MMSSSGCMPGHAPCHPLELGEKGGGGGETKLHRKQFAGLLTAGRWKHKL